MVRSISSDDRKKLRGYFDPELPPLTEETIRSLVTAWIGGPVDDENSKIEATIAAVRDKGIALSTDGKGP